MALEEHNGFILKQLDDQITNISNKMLQEYDVTSSQVRTLVFLANRRGQCTSLRDIEGYLCVAHPTIIGLVRRLEAKGYVSVKVDDRDHRYRQVAITDKGYQVYEDTIPVANKIEEIITTGMTAEESKQLHASLEKVLANLSEHTQSHKAEER